VRIRRPWLEENVNPREINGKRKRGRVRATSRSRRMQDNTAGTTSWQGPYQRAATTRRSARRRAPSYNIVQPQQPVSGRVSSAASRASASSISCTMTSSACAVWSQAAQRTHFQPARLLSNTLIRQSTAETRGRQRAIPHIPQSDVSWSIPTIATSANTTSTLHVQYSCLLPSPPLYVHDPPWSERASPQQHGLLLSVRPDDFVGAYSSANAGHSVPGMRPRVPDFVLMLGRRCMRACLPLISALLARSPLPPPFSSRHLGARC